MAILVGICFAPYVSAASSGLTLVDATWAFANADDGKLIALNHDNSILAASNLNNITLFDVATTEVIQTFQFDRVIRAIAFSPDDSKLVVSKDVLATKQDSIRLIDIAELIILEQTASADDEATEIAWSSDSSAIAAPRTDGDVSIFDGDNLFLTRTLSGVHNTEVTCIDYSNNGQFILTGDETGRYIVWNVSGGKYGQHRTINEGLVDCIFAPDNMNIVLLGSSGLMEERNLDGALMNSQSVKGGMKLIFSTNSTYLHVGYNDADLRVRGLATLESNDYNLVLETSFFHLVEDIAIIDSYTDKIDTIFVATNTGQVAIYKRNLHPDGFGDSGADLDGDFVPDFIDKDDDGDGIFDQWDNDLGCDAPANISCSRYPDLSKIRKVTLHFGDVLTIYDQITLPTEISSHIRNMSRLSIANDQKISKTEGELFSNAVCNNMDRNHVIEQWKNSIILSSGSITEGRVDCELNGGMVLVKIDDYSTQIKLTIITTFLLNAAIEYPLNVTLTDQPLATDGSLALIAPAHPMTVILSGDNGISDTIPLWWNSESENAELSMEEKIVIPPSDFDIFISYATHPLVISILLVVSFFGILYLVRRDNKIDFNLPEAEETKIEVEDIKLEYIEEFDEIYEEYIDEGITKRKKGPPIKSTSKHPQVSFADVDSKDATSKKKRRRVSDESSRNREGPIMKTKRRRLADDEPVAKAVTVKRVVTSTPIAQHEEQIIRKRRVKTYDEGDVQIPEKRLKKSPPKKNKRRKLSRRKNKSSKKKMAIDEKRLQRNLLDDFTGSGEEE